MNKIINQIASRLKYSSLLLIGCFINTAWALEIPIYQGDDTLEINQNVIILNSDLAEADVQLQFGSALSASLNWNNTDKLFVFTHNVSLSGNELINFRLENQAIIPEVCNVGISGRVYYMTTDNQPYYCNGTEWVLFSESNIPSGLPALQVRMDGSMSLDNSWASIIFDYTDIQSKPSAISHNAGDKTRIDIGEEGLYYVSYQVLAVDPVQEYRFETQVILNGASQINGSYQANTNYLNERTQTAVTFLTYLQNGNYLELQANQLLASPNVIRASMNIIKIDHIKGEKGDQGPIGSGGGYREYSEDDLLTTQLTTDYITKLSHIVQKNGTYYVYWNFDLGGGSTNAYVYGRVIYDNNHLSPLTSMAWEEKRNSPLPFHSVSGFKRMNLIAGKSIEIQFGASANQNVSCRNARILLVEE